MNKAEIFLLTDLLYGLDSVSNKGLKPSVSYRTWNESLKSKETDKEFIYTADIVGLDKSLLHFKVQGLVATLQYLNPLDERRTKFEYTFDLPEIADVESIYITYVDGELKIVVPKLARKIKHYTVQ
jgi:HSP20 family molecular chaperone IbpA